MKKKLIALLITAFLTTSLCGTAFAAETDNITSKAGITPDSILYPVDKLIEDISLALTANVVTKAQLLTGYAEERLAEAQAMIDQGKTTLAEQAVKDYSETVNEANDTIQNAVDDTAADTTVAESTTGSSIDTTTTTGTAVTTPPVTDSKIEALKVLLDKNIELQKKSVDVLAGLLEKLPEQSKDAVIAVIVKQVMRTEAIRGFVDTKKAYNDGRKDVKTAEKDVKEAEKSGDQTKVDAAKKALEDVNSKLNDLKTQQDAAWNTKKDINTLIDNKLTEMNISVPKTDENKQNDKDKAVNSQTASKVKETINNDVTNTEPKVNETIKAGDKEQNKEEIKAKVEKVKEEVKKESSKGKK